MKILYSKRVDISSFFRHILVDMSKKYRFFDIKYRFDWFFDKIITHKITKFFNVMSNFMSKKAL